MERKERLAEEFELSEECEAVREYEDLTDSYLHITATLIADEVSQCVSRQKGVAVDLGAGPGDLVKEVASRLQGFLVIGLDISFPMAQLAQRRLKNCNGLNVAFVVGDVHQLPFRPRSIAVVLSQGSMHHWRQIDGGLNQIKEVIAEGGFIYLSDLRRDAPDDVVHAVASLLNEKQARAFLNSVNAAYTIEELTAIVTEVGLNQVKVEPEAFSRRTIVKNISKLKDSPMRGMRQEVLNLRIIGGGRASSKNEGDPRDQRT